MFCPGNNERIDPPMKKEYITKINMLLPHADEELLDFIFQVLNKSLKKPVTPSEKHQQSA